MTDYIESEEFAKALDRSLLDDRRPMDEKQTEWNRARARFEAMNIRELRAYNAEGIARPYRGIAKATLKAKVQHRDAMIKIATAVAVTVGGAGALTQAIVQLAAR